MKGKFITFEGADGGGKTTQIPKMIYNNLLKENQLMKNEISDKNKLLNSKDEIMEALKIFDMNGNDMIKVEDFKEGYLGTEEYKLLSKAFSSGDL